MAGPSIYYSNSLTTSGSLINILDLPKTNIHHQNASALMFRNFGLRIT